MIKSVREVIEMIHAMSLTALPFKMIKEGTKVAEYRLYDEKRKKVNVGDRIVFTCLDDGETLTVTVTEISVYDSFLQLFTQRGGKECGCKKMSAEQLALSMREYYSAEEEQKYGAVAIGIRLIGPELKIIGRVRNDFPTKFGLPRQSGGANSIKGRIELLPEYRKKEALRGLEEYSHLWALWGFSLAEREDWSPTVRPPRLGGNTRMGVFATRSPFRPNSIGMSCLKIEKIDSDCNIWVSGCDMCDGTPVYDIKPYLPFADICNDAVGGFSDKTKDYSVKVEIPSGLCERLSDQQLEELINALRDDPRPAYKREDKKEYGFTYAGKEIRFFSDGDTLTVTDII